MHNHFINGSEIKEIVIDSTAIAPIDSSFSNENLKEFIKLMNLDYPDIVYAQAVLESGNFDSNLFRETFNIFGMKYPQSRNNLARSSLNSYAVYDKWQHSVIDYALYQSTYLHNKTREEYLSYLRRNYASDPNYVKKLNQIINEN